MKKLCYSAFIAFWSSIATLAGMYALAKNDTPGRDDGETDQVYTLEQVAQHDSLDDCWMVIDGEVYDITDYVPRHPSPPAVLAPWCGVEATEGMRTKGYGRDHSPRAWDMLEDYHIGTLQE